jgi:hypothetical protein
MKQETVDLRPMRPCSRSGQNAAVRMRTAGLDLFPPPPSLDPCSISSPVVCVTLPGSQRPAASERGEDDSEAGRRHYYTRPTPRGKAAGA